MQTLGGAAGTPTSEDIAVQSGRVCRVAGAVWSPLMSHLVFVGLLTWLRSFNVADLVWGLLHDAHEIVTSDIPIPFKCRCMSAEQSLIDDRLLDVYLGEMRFDVDFELVKRADYDAADIELVELGLIGYPKLRVAQRSEALYNDPTAKQIFYNIKSSPFYMNTTQPGAGSERLTRILEFARNRQYERVIVEMYDWNLIPKGETYASNYYGRDLC